MYIGSAVSSKFVTSKHSSFALMRQGILMPLTVKTPVTGIIAAHPQANGRGTDNMCNNKKQTERQCSTY